MLAVGSCFGPASVCTTHSQHALQHGLDIELPWLNDINRPTSTRRIPSVMTKDEVAGLLAVMERRNGLRAAPQARWMACLLHVLLI